jgi:hypothetical protein
MMSFDIIINLENLNLPLIRALVDNFSGNTQEERVPNTTKSLRKQ